MAERARLPRITFCYSAVPRRREAPNSCGFGPVYGCSFAQSNQERRTVAGVQASGGLEKRAVIAKPLYGLEGVWYCGPEVIPGDRTQSSLATTNGQHAGPSVLPSSSLSICRSHLLKQKVGDTLRRDYISALEEGRSLRGGDGARINDDPV